MLFATIQTYADAGLLCYAALMENQYLSQTRFDSFALDQRILASLQEAGFEQCSRIQAETLPHSLSGKDITGQAQTGTGKTGAFLVGVFQRLLENPPEDPQPGLVRCLILAPTRELAIQIARDAEELGKHTGLRSVLVYGGAAYEKQRRQFDQPVDILVGTPGRVIDYLKQRVFTLKDAEALVLDEADRMFDMGFIQDIRFLLRRLPPPSERLNMLFSATLSQKVLELAYEHMNNPVPVVIETKSVSADNIVEHMYYPSNSDKIPLLVGLMRKLEPFRAIAFVNTKHNAEKIDAYLNNNGIKSALISGDVRQTKRERLLKEFSDGKHQILIATDVAARGLHIDDVSHVFNFDLPQIAEDYVHRIGRTARAGASGEAHSFACEDTAFYLPDIEEYTGKSIPVSTIDAELLPELVRPQRIQRNRPDAKGGRGNNSRGGNGKPRSSQGNRSNHNSGTNQAGNRNQQQNKPKPDHRQPQSQNQQQTQPERQKPPQNQLPPQHQPPEAVVPKENGNVVDQMDQPDTPVTAPGGRTVTIAATAGGQTACPDAAKKRRSRRRKPTAEVSSLGTNPSVK
uniref:ATP-dependent RNA helicase RhlB n=1 Tax=uncultured Thiotrichaceae bacterium TaxID=298394 RepID=A0A6S6UBZ3_9GAMM|nr:MAG: ATP-dependent RNA helicase RhlB [uncultured Thiotrichaceae bacterium]